MSKTAKHARQAMVALELKRLSCAAREAGASGERNRIAREIHDTLAQGFAAIRMQLELARCEPGLPPQAAEAIELAHHIAGENLVEARRSMAMLKSRRHSLETSLYGAIDGVRRLSRTKVLATVNAVPPPPDEVAHELLRMAQEAMVNAALHARAETIEVSLTPAGEQGLRIVIVDDGQGFDPVGVAPGFGLSGARERAATVRAELAIFSEPGAGTRVVIAWRP